MTGPENPRDDAIPVEGPEDDVGSAADDHADTGARGPRNEGSVAPVRRAVQVRRLLGRSLGAAVVLGLVAGLVTLGEEVPPAAPVAAPLTQVPVSATSTTLVCPGPLRLPTEPEPGDDAAYDPQFDPALEDSDSTLRVVALEGTVARTSLLGEGESDAAGARAESGSAGIELDDAGAGTVVDALPEGETDAQAAGAVSVTTPRGDLRGLVTASCQRPSTEVWLVGGSTALGSSARLVLQNPGRTAASVTVDLWGATGPVELTGAPRFLVPPGTERVVLLEGVAAEQRRVAVRLGVSGGLVTGYVQDSSLRGLVPTGVDLVVAGRAPADRQVVPGLVVPTTEVDDVDTAQVRLLAPGTEAVRADVTLLGADGPVPLPGAQDVELEPGAVLDLPIAGVPAGAYTAVVEADGPVVAGAMLSRRGKGSSSAGPPVERSWVPSVAPGTTGTIVLPATDGTLTVGVPEGEGSSAQVVLHVLDEDGRELAPATLDVAAGTTRAVTFDELVGSGLADGAGAAAGEGTTEGEGTAEGADEDDAGADADTSEDQDPPRAVAVTLTSDDPRVTWAASVRRERSDGLLISTLVPVPRPEQTGELSVRVR